MSDIEPISRRPLVVRLTAEERRLLEVLAARWGVSLAGAVRRLLREATETCT